MNEPYDSKGLRKQTAQAGPDAIRTVDDERFVLAPGDEWSGAWSWRRYNDDFLLDDATVASCTTRINTLIPITVERYKVGHRRNGASSDRGVEWVRPFAEWLKLHHVRGIMLTHVSY